MKLSGEDLDLMWNEAKKNYIDLPAKVVIRCKEKNISLSDSQRMAMCYLQGALSVLNKNGLLCEGFFEKFEIEFETKEK